MERELAEKLVKSNNFPTSLSLVVVSHVPIQANKSSFSTFCGRSYKDLDCNSDKTTNYLEWD